MKAYHYDANGNCTGHSETTTFLEELCGFAFGGVLAIVLIPLLLLLLGSVLSPRQFHPAFPALHTEWNTPEVTPTPH